MELSFTQCKQLATNYPVLRDVIASMDDQPAWITEDLSVYDIQAIQQGGCDSGAYMPAVTYYQAIKTMSDNGDDVLQYIEDCIGELPLVPKGTSWGGIACFYLSYAVELWAGQFDLNNVDWD